jgi:asparagine synthase (glutamine-hydrolysing)
MIDAAVALAAGKPHFEDPRLRALAQEQGAQAAWHELASATDPAAELQRVGGSFAFAVHDARGRQVLAVDRFSVESLCYRVVGDRVVCSQRADELADEVTPVDPQALLDYLYFHVIPSPHTIFAGVHRLPPGHCAVFDQGRLSVTRYWHPTFREDHSQPLQALKSLFLQAMQDAVADQLTGGKPACFLSGGTDSSSVAGMLARLDRGQPATYSIGFDAQGYDEMAYARLAAQHFGTEHHEYYVTPADLVQNIPALAAHLDQPFGNSSCLPAFCCARMAREDGVEKLLAGDGGDELYGGNARYAKQRVFGWYHHVPALVRRGLIEPVVALPGADKLTLTRKAGSYIEQARLPMPDRLQLYNLLMRLGPTEVLTPALLERVDLQAPLRLQQSVWADTPGPCSDLNRELAYDWRFTLAESDLPKVNAATSMAGVQVGYPMLDDRLLALSLNLPSDYKLKGLKLRWFFKEALRGFLPDAIIEKKKHGFGLPFGVWAHTHPALQALARDSLDGLAARGVVRADFADQLVTRRLAEHPGYYGEMVWILMMLEQWLRAHAPAWRVH